jgi:hypothetical protein
MVKNQLGMSVPKYEMGKAELGMNVTIVGYSYG